MCDPRELRSRAAGASGRRRQRSKQNMASPDDFTADSLSPRNRSHQTLPVDASPDSKCPICLDRFENVASLDRCGHRFCFRCVQEWSKNKAECPLCKQPFHSIRHSMRSKDDFQVYNIRSSETESFANPGGRRFRYRTTLTRESRTSTCPRRTSSSRRTVSPPDNGILFEGLSSQPARHRDAEMHQMIRRLASRRQASLEGRSMRQIQEQEIINFRRALYRSGSRVRSIEDGGRYRDISAEFFRRNPACLHRLVPWLKRELTVLFGAHGSLVNIVQHIIMSNVTRYDLESQAFSEDLKPFLLHRTEHFLHEFISFARCPFNLEAYDQHANYDCPAPSYEEGSRSESSIITISPDEAESEHNAFSTGIGQALWDDETPGPSYSSSDQVHAPVSAALDSSESSDEETSANTVLAGLQRQLQGSVETNGDSGDSSDNCVIVGYVKPLAERTPELVQLSSDSEESVEGGTTEDVKKVQPIQCLSCSDTDLSGYSSPFSVGSRDDVSSFKTNELLSNKIKSKRSERKKARTQEYDNQTLLQSSPAKRGDDYDYRVSRKRKSDPYAHHSHSRERHGLKSKRKHHSMEIQKKKRDGSRHKHKRNKKRSRTRDKSLSRKGQDLPLSSESVVSRDPSRSRSRSNDYSRRRSESKHSDYYSRDDYQSKYRWEYTIYSRNTARGSYESSYRRWTQTRARYSRQSTRPDYGIETFSERTNSRNQRGHSDNRCYYDERHRSRSWSSSRSRSPPRGSDRMRSEKPSGKRKYKTRHLESVHRGNEETSSTKKEWTLQKSLPKCMDSNKKTTSFLERQPEAEIPHKKRKKRSRSPSVEIIYEGKTTNSSRCHKKKRKTEKKLHKSHIGYSPFSSPVVITIDSDSDKDIETQNNTECDSNISWHSTVQQNERETESPSSPIESRDCSYDKIDETENIDDDCSNDRTDKTENIDKDSSYDRTDKMDNIDEDCSVTTTREDVDETLNGILQLQGTANEHASTVSDSDISFVAGNPSSSLEPELCNQFPAVRASLMLRVPKTLLENSPEHKV
ncbi:E3 ubiquitin-protein ligase Topors [Tiliqua scincoides]|uniref:E3 ubiquitin-protein ligase Topors n=1 Tax=Tiliqua scincoides TaxID=71010 RepID=UPI003462A09B